MKKSLAIFMVLGLLFVFGAASAQADEGPFYVYLDGYCDIYEGFINYTTGTIYGRTVAFGCGDDYVMGGGLTDMYYASMANEYQNVPVINIFAMDGSLTAYANTGISLISYQSTTWHFGPAPASAELENAAALPSFMDEAVKAINAE